MHTIRLVRQIESRTLTVDFSRLQVVQLFLAGALVAALLLSGCASSSGGPSSDSQVTVTYEKSDGQDGVSEPAPEPIEDFEIAESGEEDVAQPVDDPESHVVPDPPITLAGIAQAENDYHDPQRALLAFLRSVGLLLLGLLALLDHLGLAFLDTGSYQEVTCSNFNAMPRPATVLVTGNTAAVVRRRETQEDVFRRDVIPGHLTAKAAADENMGAQSSAA